jgi:hypothetical protein
MRRSRKSSVDSRALKTQEEMSAESSIKNSDNLSKQQDKLAEDNGDPSEAQDLEMSKQGETMTTVKESKIH